MQTNASWKEHRFIGLSAIIAVFMLLLPSSVSSASIEDTINKAPIITSESTLTLTVDEAYQYKIKAIDADDNDLAYSLNQGPQGMILAGQTLDWQPTQVGEYNVMMEVNDQNGGYDVQAWKISVTHGAATVVVITPNERPTLVNIGDNQQFKTEVYDQYGNIIANVAIIWSTDAEYGSVSENGLFTAKKGGITHVAVSSQDAKTSIGIVVKDIRSALANAQEEETTTEETEDEIAVGHTVNSNTNTDVTNSNASEQGANEEKIEILGEETANDAEAAEEETKEACTNWPHWLIILIPIAYGVMLLAYLMYIKKEKTGSWWILPALLTAITLIIYYKYVCSGTYAWWPWLIIGISVIVTLSFRPGRRKSNSGESQIELPF